MFAGRSERGFGRRPISDRVRFSELGAMIATCRKAKKGLEVMCRCPSGENEIDPSDGWDLDFCVEAAMRPKPLVAAHESESRRKQCGLSSDCTAECHAQLAGQLKCSFNELFRTVSVLTQIQTKFVLLCAVDLIEPYTEGICCTSCCPGTPRRDAEL